MLFLVFLYRYQVPNLMIDTPAAIVSRAITKKLGFIKKLRGSGAVEKNSHFSPRP